MFQVFLKDFICVLTFYFCFYLADLGIGDFIGTAIDNITKYNLLTNHFKPDHNYEFSSRFQRGCVKALNYHWLIFFPLLILYFVYHPPYLANHKRLKKVNFPKMQDFHLGL